MQNMWKSLCSSVYACWQTWGLLSFSSLSWSSTTACACSLSAPGSCTIPCCSCKRRHYWRHVWWLLFRIFLPEGDFRLHIKLNYLDELIYAKVNDTVPNRMKLHVHVSALVTIFQHWTGAAKPHEHFAMLYTHLARRWRIEYVFLKQFLKSFFLLFSACQSAPSDTTKSRPGRDRHPAQCQIIRFEVVCGITKSRWWWCRGTSLKML